MRLQVSELNSTPSHGVDLQKHVALNRPKTLNSHLIVASRHGPLDTPHLYRAIS